MRTLASLAPTLLAALVALAPHAAAQATMTPPEAMLAPLGPPVEIPIRVETDCPPDAAASGIHVAYAITRLPAWAQGVVTPSSDQEDYASCAGGRAVFHAVARVAATQDAPAFVPDTLEVTARVTRSSLTNEAPMRAVVPLTASYSSILDAQAAIAQRAAAPREIVTFPITMSNLGNGNTKVTFEVGEHDPGVYPAAPAPIVLGSKQTGARDTSRVVLVQAYRLSSASGPTAFTIRYTSAYALDAKLAGDSGVFSFRLLPRSSPTPEGDTTPPSESTSPLDKFAPGPALPLALVPLGLAALLMRRRLKRAG